MLRQNGACSGETARERHDVNVEDEARWCVGRASPHEESKGGGGRKA